MTQRLAHTSPGNGAPNFKGLPPGRKRTANESGDTSWGATAINPRTAKKNKINKESLFAGVRTCSGFVLEDFLANAELSFVAVSFDFLCRSSGTNVS